ncbi:MAG: transcription termination/antitermination factor NusG [Chloroflexi bacterium]|nr:transcription termination/antitermination factor NusG [Planctomycetota bacterium]RLC62290.1 MAG: transcription termination/antitermination factor NusG [Chloroflexota bacterium]
MTEIECDQQNGSKAQQWFVLRVQSNREERVRSNLVRVLEMNQMHDRVPEVLVPTEAVTEMREGKREVVQRKLFPGYVIVQVQVDEHDHIPDQLWQLIRETNGVGDFIGAERPWPMRNEEVARLLGRTEEIEAEAPKLDIDLNEGEMIRIKEGPFQDVEGHVEEINPASGKVKVVINIFNRSTPVELEYWQVERL